MLVSSFYVTDGGVRLRSLTLLIEKAIEKAGETPISEEKETEFKTTFNSIAGDMVSGFSELITTTRLSDTDMNRFIIARSTLVRTIKKLKILPLDELLQAIKDVRETISGSGITDYTERAFKEEFVKMAIDTAMHSNLTMEHMASAIKVDSDREINFLDVTPGSGNNMAAIKEHLGNVKMHAAFAKENYYSTLRTVMDRVAIGNSKGSNISNESFDVMLVRPVMTFNKSDDRALIKREKDIIRDTAKYLRPGGVVMLLIPAFRFYKDICVLVSKLYKDVQIRRTATGNYSDDDYVYVLGVRKDKADKEVDKDAYKILRQLFLIDISTTIDEPYEQIKLPVEKADIRLFKGSILSKEELVDLYNNSGCMDRFFGAQEVSRMSEAKAQPLLPFSTGQLGLVLTSGCLDGVIDEGNGHFHVVKGRVVKKTETTRSEDKSKGEVEWTETTTNRVEINVITADGTLKVLA